MKIVTNQTSNMSASTPVNVFSGLNNTSYSGLVSSVNEYNNESELPKIGVSQAFFIMTGIIGVLSNGFAIHVLCYSKTLRRQFVNIFLINQSIADFLASLFIICESYMIWDSKLITTESSLQDQYCRWWASEMALWTSLWASTGNLVVINIERYVSVVHPIFYKTVLNQKHIAIIISIVWLQGVFGSVPIGYMTSYVDDYGWCVTWSKWPHESGGIIYGTFAFVFNYLFAVIIMIGVYFAMFSFLQKRSKVTVVTGSSSTAESSHFNSRQARDAKVQRNLIKTLLIVSLWFFVCWTPNKVSNGHVIDIFLNLSQPF
mgnify:CR=1 FL=1